MIWKQVLEMAGRNLRIVEELDTKTALHLLLHHLQNDQSQPCGELYFHFFVRHGLGRFFVRTGAGESNFVLLAKIEQGVIDELASVVCI